MISYIISLFLIAFVSAQEVTESPLEERGEVHSRRSSKESSRKKTVCSITINSDEEVKTFKKHLKGFDFVELVPHDSESEKKDWFSKACKKDIQCDVLIISGHFGGRFFGKSGHSLSTALLEEKSCDKQCSGILHKPKEVFLMGCNTLAGKHRDHRTQEEYTRVLIDDGFSQIEAQEIAAFRYSPIGNDMHSRMRNVFAGVEKVYGFDSVGPSGKTVEPLLERYLSGKDYESHLKYLTPRSSNEDLAHELRYSAFTQTSGRKIEKIEKRPVCLLNDKSIPGYKKTNWMVKQLKNKKNRLKYIPHFQRLLEKRRKSGYKWSQAELQQLADLKNDPELTRAFDALIEKSISGMLGLQIDIVKLMKELKLVNKDEYKERVASLVLQTELTNNISYELKDEICSANVQVDIPIENLPKEHWSEQLVDTIGCLKPQNKEVHLALARNLSDKNSSVRLKAASALGNIKPQNKKVHLALVRALYDKEASVRYNAASALQDIKPQNKEIHLALVRVLYDKDASVSDYAASALGYIRPQDKEIHLALAKALSDKNSSVRSNAASALGYIRPQDKEIHLALAKALSDKNSSVRSNAASALGYSKPQDKEIHLALAKALSDKNSSVRLKAASALGYIRPQDKEIHLALAKALSDKNSLVRFAAASALGYIRPQNKEIHLALVRVLSDKSSFVRSAAASALEAIKRSKKN